jgi:hypothetical protein
MDFIKPRNSNRDKVEWLISEQTRTIVKYYAEYTDYSEDEVADMFLKNILKDKEFMDWIDKKRNNKRFYSKMIGEDNSEGNDKNV